LPHLDASATPTLHGGRFLDFARPTINLLVANAREIITAGIGSAIVAALVFAALACLTVFWLHKRHWLRGRVVLTMLAVTGLLGCIGVGGLFAIPAGVERATEIVASRSAELKLNTPIGRLLLMPVVDAYTEQGSNGRAIDDMHGPVGLDLAVLVKPDVQAALGSRIDEEQMSRTAKGIRREIRVPSSRIPPRLIRHTLDSAQRSFAQSSDIYGDLLTSLVLDEDGVLPVRMAAGQVGRRFFANHANEAALRGLGNDHRWFALVCLVPFMLMLGFSTLFGALSFRRNSAQ
jgi:hypothetical protein